MDSISIMIAMALIISQQACVKIGVTRLQVALLCLWPRLYEGWSMTNGMKQILYTKLT